MRLKPHKPSMTLLLIAVLVALLTVLAILQYRWLGQISIAERQTMQTNLRNQARGLQEEINLEIDKFGSRLRLSAASLRSESWDELAERYNRWKDNAAYPGLIKNLFLAHTDRDGQFELMKLDDSARQFKPILWPENFADIRSRFEPKRFSSGREGELKEPGPIPGREIGSLIEHGYTVESIPAIARFTVEFETMQGPDNQEARRRVGPDTINEFLRSPLAISVLDIDYIKQVFIPALFKRRLQSTALSTTTWPSFIASLWKRELKKLRARGKLRLLIQATPRSTCSASVQTLPNSIGDRSGKS